MEKDDGLGLFYEEVEKALQGHGQDLAMRGAEIGVQRWGSPELAVAVSVITLWFLQTVMKTIIEQKVKDLLHSKNKELSDQIKKIERQLEELDWEKHLLLADRDYYAKKLQDLESTFSLVIRELITTGNVASFSPIMHLQELEHILMDLGITKRRAKRLAPRLQDAMLQTLLRISGQTHRCCF